MRKTCEWTISIISIAIAVKWLLFTNEEKFDMLTEKDQENSNTQNISATYSPHIHIHTYTHTHAQIYKQQ